MTDVYEFLEHHGVKGQRWGFRKKEETGGDHAPAKPKPTKQERRNERAKKYTARASEADKRLAEINQQLSSSPTGSTPRYKLRKEQHKLIEKRDQALKDAEAKKQGKLSHREKQVAIGAAAAAVIVAAGVTYANIQSGNATRLVGKGKAFLHGGEGKWRSPGGFKMNPKLATKDMTEDAIMSSVVRQINPGFKNGQIGTKMNCKRCTYAYEMRRRGYDVAATRTTNGRGQSVAGFLNATRPGEKDWVGPKATNIGFHAWKEQLRKSKNPNVPTPVSDILRTGEGGLGKRHIPVGHRAEEIFHSLSLEPNGSRGELGMIWNAGGGHSVAYEIVKGKPVIFDTQSGKKFSSEAEFESYFRPGSIAKSAYTRLDNLPMNEDFLRRWLKDA